MRFHALVGSALNTKPTRLLKEKDMSNKRLSIKNTVGVVLTLTTMLSMGANASLREKGVDPETSAKAASPSKIQVFICENTGLWCPK